MTEFFEPLGNYHPYIKIGFNGFSGSGKSYTAAEVAMGLHELIESKKPICLFDTEQAAKNMRQRAAGRNIPVIVKRSRSLADLKETFKACIESAADILVIDSISHIWLDWLTAYQVKKKRPQRLYFADWQPVKEVWRSEFSEPMVNLPLHVIFTGRASWDYEMIPNEQGKLEPIKSGVKMAAEKETAYEADLYALLERCEETLGDSLHVWRRGKVLKDRADILDGEILNKEGATKGTGFADYEPSIRAMLSDAQTAPETESIPAVALVTDEEGRADWIQRKEAALDIIKETLNWKWPGTTKGEKKAKLDALQECFGTVSRKELEILGLDLLETGVVALRALVRNGVAKEKEPESKEEPKQPHWQDICKELDASEAVTKKVRVWVHVNSEKGVDYRRYHAENYIRGCIAEEKSENNRRG